MKLMRTVPGEPARLTRETRMFQRLLAPLSRGPFLPSPRRYNLTISHERKLLWFRVAKAGTRTILHHLESQGVPLDIEHASFIHYSPRLFADYFKFAFVRNPWDRLVSCHTNKVVEDGGKLFGFDEQQQREMLSFENFVEFVAGLDLKACDRHLRLQTELIDLNHVDFVGRMETFAEDFRQVCERAGIPGSEVHARNVGRHAPYQSYYTDALRDKVASLYRKDIQVFGYRFAPAAG